MAIFSNRLAQGDENLPGLIKRIEPSIVVILAYDGGKRLIGQGSGFFISSKGDVITNYHVLEKAFQAEVRLSDGTTFPIQTILGEDEEGDLIRVWVDIKGKRVQPLTVNEKVPEVGEKVVVMGTPLGLEKTVSDGIVSAVRDIPRFGKILQVTAPISLGSSGSPVINMKGEVIGIVTFYVLAGQNLNFAIPGSRIAVMPERGSKSLAAREERKKKERFASADASYRRGLRFLWMDKCELALPHFLEAVRSDPQRGDAHFQIGYCAEKLGMYEEAARAYQKTGEINPRDDSAFSNLCMVYGKLYRLDEAIDSCRRAIQINPALAEAHNNLAWALYRLERYDEAIDSCLQAIRLAPDFAQAHFNLGNNYSALKKFEKAAESYKQAIRIQFLFAEAHMNLGAAYDQLGRYEEAISSYKRAVLIKPNLAEAHLNLGMTFLKIGDRGSALEEYKILKDLNQEMANRLFHLIYE